MKERILRFWGIIRPRETNAFIWLALIVGLALVIRVVWVLVSQTTPVNEASVYDRLAWSLASDKEYVSKDGTPTAFRPVGYPGFLAGVYLVFGRSWIVGGIANALLGTVTVGLTYMLARTVLSIRLSLAAALLIALLPSHIFGYTAVLRMEALHTVFVLCALVLTYWAVCAPRVQVNCVQLFYNLSDPGMEDLLYEAESVRRFVGLRLSDSLPDETTILNFRHRCPLGSLSRDWCVRAPNPPPIPSRVRSCSAEFTSADQSQASDWTCQRHRVGDATSTPTLGSQKLLCDGCLYTDFDPRRYKLAGREWA